MNLFINREGPVPIHDQLCAQISQMVAAGTLAPGEKLPSIRALAQRTSLHHNTVMAAYQTLEARGLVVIKEGSGARVADHAALAAGPAVNGLAREYVTRARQTGADDAAIRAAVDRVLDPEPIARLTVVNPHPDLQDLYMHELAQHFDFPLAAMSLEDVAEATPEQRAETAFLTSTNHAKNLAPLLGDGRPPILFQLESSDALLSRVKALPEDAVVAVVSASPRFLFLTHEMLSAARGEASLLAASIEDASALGTALRLATLIVADVRVHAQVRRGTQAEVIRLPLLAESFFDELARHLPAKARRA